MKIPELRRAPHLVIHVAWIGMLLAGATAWSEVCLAQNRLEHSSSSLPATHHSRSTPDKVEAIHSAPGACLLLSEGTIKKVQSEPLKDKKSTQAKSGSLIVSQCFYSLPTFANSICVTLALPDSTGPSRSATRRLWESLFHRAPESQEQGERGREISSEEREEHTPPKEILGLGDEAYWIPNMSGALYVLKGNALLRISVGGKLDDAERLIKSKELAQDALQHLP